MSTKLAEVDNGLMKSIQVHDALDRGDRSVGDAIDGFWQFWREEASEHEHEKTTMRIFMNVCATTIVFMIICSVLRKGKKVLERSCLKLNVRACVFFAPKSLQRQNRHLCTRVEISEGLESRTVAGQTAFCSGAAQ